MLEILLFIFGFGIIGSYAILVPILFITLYKSIKYNHVIKFRKEFLLLFLFSISYSLIGLIYGTFNYYYGGIFILIYLLGQQISKLDSSNRQLGFRLLFSFLLGIAVHAIINLFYNLSLGNLTRDIVDIWTKQQWSSTGQAVLLNPIIALTPLVIRLKMSKKMRFFLVVMYILIFTYVLYLGTRSSLIVLMFVFSIQIVFDYSFRKIKLKSLIYLLIMVLITIAIITFDIVNVRTFLLNTNLFSRFTEESTQTSDIYRLELLKTAIKTLFKYPFGTNSEYTFAHNLWFDVARQSGVIPFVLLTLYSVATYKSVTVFLGSKHHKKEAKNVILLLYAGALIIFFFEPILETALTFFIFLLAVNGYVNSENVITRGRYYNEVMQYQ